MLLITKKIYHIRKKKFTSFYKTNELFGKIAKLQFTQQNLICKLKLNYYSFGLNSMQKIQNLSRTISN